MGARGPLDLTAGLERDRSPRGVDSDQLVGLEDRVTSALGSQKLEDPEHGRILALVGQGLAGHRIAAHFLQLHPDLPLFARDRSPQEVVQQHVPIERSRFASTHLRLSRYSNPCIHPAGGTAPRRGRSPTRGRWLTANCTPG